MPPSRGAPPPPSGPAGAEDTDPSEDPSGHEEFCGGCPPGRVRAACRASFARLGAQKMHWECWSNCNLSCGFCYRSVGSPLATADGKRLLEAVATAGTRTVVFAGGDPALRDDLGRLLDHARLLGLVTEVHTNARFAPERVRQALAAVDCVGLSLDAPDPALHDRIRGGPGNYKQVFSLLGFLDQARVPVIVRTVVMRPNQAVVADIGQQLRPYRNVLAWYLLEFSPVGLGFAGRLAYELPRARFDEVVDAAVRRYRDVLEVHPRRLEDKSGGYVLITPDGLMYGTAGDTVAGRYPHTGAVLRDHLSDLATRIGFQRERHEPRYAEIEAMRLLKRATLTGPAEGFPSSPFHVQSPQKENSSGLT
jgi:pyruvate-formate lyase-activating enzyme